MAIIYSIKMKMILRVSIFQLSFFAAVAANGQDSSKIFVTTGAGIIKSPGPVGRVFHPSIAFNSGIELVVKKNWYVQGTLDFNTLKYNQQKKENGSPYLFQNTNSSLVMVAVNGGKNFPLGNHRWFASAYMGGGYLNIGEPRLINVTENIIRQAVSRKGGVFGKAGTRTGYKTNIKFLQTIYFDGAFWASPLKAQGSDLNGFSFFLGARMNMK
jgi:hypothetical protein